MKDPRTDSSSRFHTMKILKFWINMPYRNKFYLILVLICFVIITVYHITAQSSNSDLNLNFQAYYSKRTIIPSLFTPEQINKHRLKHLNKICQELKNSSDNNLIQKYETFHFKDSEKLHGKNRFKTWYYGKDWVFCTPPKAGTSNWQRTLIGMKEGKSPEEVLKNEGMYNILPRVLNLKSFMVYSSDMTIDTRTTSVNSNPYQNFIQSKKNKILSVRHPIERLFSAWHNKFSLNHKYVKKYINKYSRKIPKNYKTPPGMACSFQDFIDYWLLEMERYAEYSDKYKDPNILYNKIMQSFDHHWRPILWQCLPCNTNFNYISKLETIDRDSNLILKEVFHLEDVEHSVYKMMPQYSNHLGIDSEIGYLNETVREKLRRALYWDLRLFGYEY